MTVPLPPEGYLDPRDGQLHDWDDIAPLGPDEYDDGGPHLTYRQLVDQIAEAKGMSLDEYAELHLGGGDREDDDDPYESDDE